MGCEFPRSLGAVHVSSLGDRRFNLLSSSLYPGNLRFRLL